MSHRFSPPLVDTPSSPLPLQGIPASRQTFPPREESSLPRSNRPEEAHPKGPTCQAGKGIREVKRRLRGSFVPGWRQIASFQFFGPAAAAAAEAAGWLGGASAGHGQFLRRVETVRGLPEARQGGGESHHGRDGLAEAGAEGVAEAAGEGSQRGQRGQPASGLQGPVGQDQRPVRHEHWVAGVEKRAGPRGGRRVPDQRIDGEGGPLAATWPLHGPRRPLPARQCLQREPELQPRRLRFPPLVARPGPFDGAAAAALALGWRCLPRERERERGRAGEEGGDGRGGGRGVALPPRSSIFLKFRLSAPPTPQKSGRARERRRGSHWSGQGGGAPLPPHQAIMTGD